MLSFIKLVILSAVQGITEILPVSSSGHLVIVENLLNCQQTLTFKIFLHFATLLAIIIYFRKDLGIIIKSLHTGDKQGLSLLWYIILGSIPAGIVGIFLKDAITSLFQQPKITAILLLMTGTFVLFAGLKRENEKRLNSLIVLAIGSSHALAILPGISRSGFTIGIALLLGIKRERAFTFAFLLAIPAILGANLLELVNKNFGDLSWQHIIAGIVAFLIGYLSIKLLGSAVQKGKFFIFGIYCWVAGSLFYLILL